jgi:hypothetical protein
MDFSARISLYLVLRVDISAGGDQIRNRSLTCPPTPRSHHQCRPPVLAISTVKLNQIRSHHFNPSRQALTLFFAWMSAPASTSILVISEKFLLQATMSAVFPSYQTVHSDRKKEKKERALLRFIAFKRRKFRYSPYPGH